MKINNFYDNYNLEKIEDKGIFQIFARERDLSLNDANEAQKQYYMSSMDVKRRQVVVNLNNSGVILSNGAMLFTAGRITMDTGIKGVGDFLGKAFSAKVTGEDAIKPHYRGTGSIFLEPDYCHYIVVDITEFGNLVVSDNMFYACEDTVDLKLSVVKSISGSLLGGEGLFNLRMAGKGNVLLKSPCTEDELIEVYLSEGDELKVDGPLALIWDDGLNFTVEKSSKSLIGSAASGEGLVNVYRGTGRVWLTC